MPSSPVPRITSTTSRLTAVPTKLLESTRYVLASREPHPYTDEWMTSEQATEFLLSDRKPPSKHKLYAQCLMCANVFTKPVTKFRAARAACENLNHTCCNACSAQYRSLGTQVELSCGTCGKRFAEWQSSVEKKRAKGQTEFFCCSECYGVHRSKTYVGDLHPTSTLRDYNCDHCGETFKRSPYRAGRQDHQFCNVECYRGWLTGRPTRKGTGRRGERSYPAEFKAARRTMLPAPCVVCDKPALDLHHRDGNIEHNEPENLAPVCRKCHMRHHHQEPNPLLSPSSE